MLAKKKKRKWKEKEEELLQNNDKYISVHRLLLIFTLQWKQNILTEKALTDSTKGTIVEDKRYFNIFDASKYPLN